MISILLSLETKKMGRNSGETRDAKKFYVTIKSNNNPRKITASTITEYGLCESNRAKDESFCTMHVSLYWNTVRKTRIMMFYYIMKGNNYMVTVTRDVISYQSYKDDLNRRHYAHDSNVVTVAIAVTPLSICRCRIAHNCASTETDNERVGEAVPFDRFDSYRVAVGRSSSASILHAPGISYPRRSQLFWN